MAKKKKKKQETTIEDFYDLKADKVDELVAALKGETAEDEEPVTYDVAECVGAEGTKYGEEREYSDGKVKKGQKFNPYKLDRLSRVPTWIKAVFIKFWFAGMVSFFIIMGLQSYFDQLDLIFFTGVVLGIVVDFLVNPIFRYFESDEKEYDWYTMFPFPLKKFWTIFANILYYMIIVFLTNFIFYFGINEICNSISGTADITYLAIEPVSFGLFIVVVDMIFIGVKDLIVFLIKKAKNKKSENVTDV